MPRPAYVQTDLEIHEMWAELVFTDQRAAAVLHVLVANLTPGCDPVVVLSQKALAKRCRCAPRTLQRTLYKLEADNWIEILKIGKGTVSAYRLHERVAWVRKRGEKDYAKTSGTIIVEYEDQTESKTEPLQPLAIMVDGNITIPKQTKKAAQEVQLRLLDVDEENIL